MSYSLRTIWRSGPVVGPHYVKFDDTGTLINVDRFVNFRNYYWTGVTLSPVQLPSYNSAGLVEYYVIETGGSSDWSAYNFWTHVSQLKKSDLSKYVQAEKPIIEFNKSLESQLLASKTRYGQLPKFSLYIRVDNVLSPAINFVPGLNDEYAQSHLLADVEDLVGVASSIAGNQNLLDHTFTYAGRTYIQSLFNGFFVPTKDGVTYGYFADLVQSPPDKGSVSGIVCGSACDPQVITLTYSTTSGDFLVSGSYDGVQVVHAMDGVPYVLGGVTFTVVSGATPLEDGDVFVIAVKSFVYEPIQLYVSLNGSPRTLTSAVEILNETDTFRVINADSSAGDGIWEVPPQLEWNVQNETRVEVSQSDLFTHFSSIIQAQPDLVGDSIGINNWRNLSSPSLGLGGLIKQYDGDTSLLISMLLQDGISYPSLLEFAKQSYRALQAEIKTFIEDVVPEMLVTGDFITGAPYPGEPFTSENLLFHFKNYLSNKSQVVISSATSLDDNLASIFFDSTSSLFNLVATLPYLGLVAPVQPAVALDLELNMEMIVYHDGHKTEVPTISTDLLKNLVQKKYLRSSGQETAGIISGGTIGPVKPYRGQFWFKTTTNQLFFYDVVSDTGELPADAAIGSYSYDRQTDNIWQFNGTWNLLGNTAVLVEQPFKFFDISATLLDLTLTVETELYNNCPPLVAPINTVALEADPSFNSQMQLELERFGAYFGISNVFGGVFDSDNAFTWNYKATLGIATWQQYYLQRYGTSRPDLQPWIPAGYVSEAALLADLITATLLPGGTTAWDTSFWMLSGVVTFLRAKYVANSKPSLLSINLSTGALIPPYDPTDLEAFISTPPANATAAFVYGDLGPVELVWTRSVDYLYSKQKVYFRIDPLDYISSTWGTKSTVLDSYTFNTELGKKLSVAELQLHGDALASSLEVSQLQLALIVPPTADLTFTLSCVSRVQNIFKLSGGDLALPVFITGFSGASTYFSLDLVPGLRGFYWGDTFTINIDDVGGMTVTISSATYLSLEGIGQLYTQYLRAYGQDAQVSLNQSLFHDWTAKIGYRFGGLINTDLLNVKALGASISNTSSEVLIKENKFTKSTWLNALRVSVARKGSAQRVGNLQIPRGDPPGADWIFRVDNFNPQRPTLTWNTLDTSGEFKTFHAAGAASTVVWKRYTTKTGTFTAAAPFLITGLQNVINFIFGYSDKLTEEGWRFNDQEGAVFDAATGRAVNYQLQVEQFINLMYSGANDGTAFLFNPFAQKVWFQTDHGVVTNLGEPFGVEQETVPKLLTSAQKQLPLDQVRVFRQDDLTEFNFDEQVFTFHLLTSEYEHVILFDNYATDNVLFYDPFLGQLIDKIFFEGRKQDTFTGRLDFGGHFLLGGEMKRSIESSIESVSQLYETTNTIASLPEVQRARASLGFQHKSYFDLRETSDQTEFRFWQGMIGRKGTNFAVDAFINSSKYQTASLDEFWAFKLAEYGDSRRGGNPEMKVFLSDVNDRRTSYLLLEDPSDSALDPTMIMVDPTDESRWFAYDDLSSLKSVEAVVIAEQLVTLTYPLGKLIQIVDTNGLPVHADCFEMVNTLTDEVLHESGDVIIGSSPVEYSPPKFARVNHSSIKILDDTIIGFPFKVIAYGPPLKSYSPSQLYNYDEKVLVKDDIIWWDPARGVHDSLAISQVDLQQTSDPATYNVALVTPLVRRDKPWGANQVGTTWWNTLDLIYQPYYDDKIYPDASSRLDRWGGLSEYSKVEVYEWVASDVPPEKYAGDLGVDRYVTRSRTWQQRPVAWRYSSNPVASSRVFAAYQPSKLKVGSTALTLKTGRFSSFGLVSGMKIAGAIYSSTTKLDSQITEIFGTTQITGKETFTIGSSAGYDDGALFVASPYFTLSAELDLGTLSFIDEPCGHYILGTESDGASYLTLTHVETGKFQRLVIVDTPVIAGTKATYFFDNLGVKINYVTTYGHADSWGILGVLSQNARIAQEASVIGNSLHQIYIRSQVKSLLYMPFDDGTTLHSTLDAQSDVTTLGWIAWTDPATNPINGAVPPLNLYQPIAGNWVNVGDRLSDISTDISTRMTDPWLWFDGESFVPYRSSWSSWSPLLLVRKATRYDTTNPTGFANTFAFTSLTSVELTARVKAYVNGVRILDRFSIVSVGAGSKLVFDPSILTEGWLYTVTVEPQTVTKAELAFDPTVKDDPLTIVQYKRDRPYVVETRRGTSDGLTVTNYYFWAKNKPTAAASKKQSVLQISEALAKRADAYCVPLLLKFADQVDGRPNRYASISVENLNFYVRRDGAFKIRFKSSPFLRSSDEDLGLKNIHEEWVLIRPYQSSKLPKSLWDVAIDTVAGVNQVGETMPNPSLTLYDQRTGSSSSYGPRPGQVLTDVAGARAAVKFMIMNTRVNKYVNQVLLPDYISYPGFDINTLDDQLSTPEGARKLMSDIWRLAKPKQINEIFFAIFEDGLSKNLEMPDFFKTSYVAIDDIHTVTFPSGSLENNLDLTFGS